MKRVTLSGGTLTINVIVKEKKEDDEEEEEGPIGIQNFYFFLNTEIFLKKTQIFYIF